jgi:hypothetical protein
MRSVVNPQATILPRGVRILSEQEIAAGVPHIRAAQSPAAGRPAAVLPAVRNGRMAAGDCAPELDAIGHAPIVVVLLVLGLTRSQLPFALQGADDAAGALHSCFTPGRRNPKHRK